MQTITRHGGGSHYVRPDRVYRTGVLTSAMGYDPGSDVQDVVESFTAYPMDLSIIPPGGLAGLGGLGLVDRMRMSFKTWQARQRAKKIMRARGLHGLGVVPSVAYARVGNEVAPHMVSKEEMTAYLTQAGNQMPDNFARSQAESSWRGWSKPWWAPR